MNVNRLRDSSRAAEMRGEMNTVSLHGGQETQLHRHHEGESVGKDMPQKQSSRELSGYTITGGVRLQAKDKGLSIRKKWPV